jgi:hypothetical protein
VRKLVESTFVTLDGVNTMTFSTGTVVHTYGPK